MRRFFIPVVLWLLVAGLASAAAEHGQLDVSPSLFTVMAAINAAGYDAELQSPNNHPLRQQVIDAVSARNAPVVAELKKFFAAHRQANPTAELSQYVSVALAVTPPPDFNLRFRSNQIPPDVLPLYDGFLPLLQRFYDEAGIAVLWERSQPVFEEAIARYHEPVSLAVQQVGGYLRIPSGPYLGRRFQVYLDLLGAPNQVQTRSYADDYFVVVTASAEPRVEDVRHAYLHYILDPMATKYGMELLKKRAISDLAQPAPALDDRYKSDFLLLATESLIKAVEARLPGSKASVEQALHEGYILAPFFAEQLSVYEKQLDAMRLFFPEMVNHLNPGTEAKRLAGVQFDAKPRERAAKMAAERKVEPATARDNAALEEAERLYGARDLDKARQAFLHLLQQAAEPGVHARAYYGLARIAVLQKDPETGERLFRKVLESSPEPSVEAWTHIYLGRLSAISGDGAQAAEHYQTALAVNGASPAARREAEKSMRETSQKQPN